jgi:hypothetical protein
LPWDISLCDPSLTATVSNIFSSTIHDSISFIKPGLGIIPDISIPQG